MVLLALIYTCITELVWLFWLLWEPVGAFSSFFVFTGFAAGPGTAWERYLSASSGFSYVLDKSNGLDDNNTLKD